MKPVAEAACPPLPAGHDSHDPETAIDSRETSRILGLSPVTLQQLRARGDGPPFFRIGRTVRYRLGDVLSWRDARTVGRKPPAAAGSNVPPVTTGVSDPGRSSRSVS